jgi:hypothetical protein
MAAERRADIDADPQRDRETKPPALSRDRLAARAREIEIVREDVLPGCRRTVPVDLESSDVVG